MTESLNLQRRPDAEPVLWAFTHGRGAWRVTLKSDSEPQACVPDRWIPHVTPAGISYETTVFATNFSAAPASIELVPYLENGIRLPSVSLEVNPGATRIASSGDLFSNQPVSHFGICGSFSVSVTAAYRSTAASSTSAHVPEVTQRGTEFLFYPGEWNVVYEGMAVINLGAEASRVKAVLLNQTGEELRLTVLSPALAPYAKQLAVLDWEFRGLQGAVIRIESSQPSAILFLRGTHPEASTALLYYILPALPGATGIPAPGLCNPERWILHLTPQDSGYETTILATNRQTSDVALEIVPLQDDRTRLDSIFWTIAAGHSLIAPASGLFAGTPISHFGLCGSATTRVTAAYRSLLAPSASAHSPETSVTDNRFLFYPGEWPVVYEGMAVVNRGTNPEWVDAVLLDAQGYEVRRVRLIDRLAPRAKHLAVLDGIFSDFAGVAIRIECSEPSSVLLLRGTKPGHRPGVLFQTVPIAITPRR